MSEKQPTLVEIRTEVGGRLVTSYYVQGRPVFVYGRREVYAGKRYAHVAQIYPSSHVVRIRVREV